MKPTKTTLHYRGQPAKTADRQPKTSPSYNSTTLRGASVMTFETQPTYPRLKAAVPHFWGKKKNLATPHLDTMDMSACIERNLIATAKIDESLLQAPHLITVTLALVLIGIGLISYSF